MTVDELCELEPSLQGCPHACDHVECREHRCRNRQVLVELRPPSPADGDCCGLYDCQRPEEEEAIECTDVFCDMPNCRHRQVLVEVRPPAPEDGDCCGEYVCERSQENECVNIQCDMIECPDDMMLKEVVPPMPEEGLCCGVYECHSHERECNCDDDSELECHACHLGITVDELCERDPLLPGCHDDDETGTGAGDESDAESDDEEDDDDPSFCENVECDEGPTERCQAFEHVHIVHRATGINRDCCDEFECVHICATTECREFECPDDMMAIQTHRPNPDEGDCCGQFVCEAHSGPGSDDSGEEEDDVCCDEATAACMACAAGVTIEEVCDRQPHFPDCPNQCDNIACDEPQCRSGENLVLVHRPNPDEGICCPVFECVMELKHEGEACGACFSETGFCGDCARGLECQCVGACADPRIADAPSTCVNPNEIRSTDSPTDTPRACCRALTAECLACNADMTVEEFCARNEQVIGCPTESPTRTPDIVCADRTKRKFCSSRDGCAWVNRNCVDADSCEAEARKRRCQQDDRCVWGFSQRRGCESRPEGLCEHEQLRSNKRKCKKFGCTWDRRAGCIAA